MSWWIRPPGGTLIGAEGDKIVLQGEDIIRLIHTFRESGRAGPDDIKKDRPRVFAQDARDLAKALAAEVPVGWRLDLPEDHLVPIPAAKSKPIFPTITFLHLPAHFGAVCA